MKHQSITTLLACLFVFASQNLNAQNWSPFLYPEVHTFQHPESPYFSLRADSAVSLPGLIRHYPNRNIMRSDCFQQDSCLQQHGWSGYFQSRAGKLGDIVEQHGDGRMDFIFLPTDTFHIDMGAVIGQAQTFNMGMNLNATLHGFQVRSVLGSMDSVAVFSISNGDSVILSKDHGIVAIPDLKALLYPACMNDGMMWLKGLQMANLGKQMPGFLEIYDFAPGDRFETRHDVQFYNRAFTRWEVLSQRQLSTNQDTISHVVAMEWLYIQFQPTMQVTYTPLDTLTLMYIRDMDYRDTLLDGAGIQTSAPAFEPAHYRLRTDTSFQMRSMFRNGPTALVIGDTYINSGCNDYYTEVIDGISTSWYAEGLGKVRNEYQGFAPTVFELTCYRKNGLDYGSCQDWSVYLGNSPGQSELPQIQMAPNPSSGLVRLQALNFNNAGRQVQVLDPQGRVVQVEEWRAGSNTLELDLRMLPEGVYWIRSGGWAGKFLKME